nr:hypothetical protein [Escherichia coli]
MSGQLLAASRCRRHRGGCLAHQEQKVSRLISSASRRKRVSGHRSGADRDMGTEA